MLAGYLHRASMVMLSNKEATLVANLWVGHFGPPSQKGSFDEDVVMVTS